MFRVLRNHADRQSLLRFAIVVRCCSSEVAAASQSSNAAQSVAAAAHKIHTSAMPIVEDTVKPSLESLKAGKLLYFPEHPKKYMPEGLAGDAELEFITTKKPAILIRPQTVEIATSLHQLEETKKKDAKGYLLSGLKGTGKSLILDSLVYHFRRRGWFVLFIPNARYFVDGMHNWERDPVRPGFYKQPDPAMMAIQKSVLAHGDLLQQIPVSAFGDISWLSRTPRHKEDDEDEINELNEMLRQELEESLKAEAAAAAEPKKQGGKKGQQQSDEAPVSKKSTDPRREFVDRVVVPDVKPENVKTAYDLLCSATHRKRAAPYAFDGLCRVLSTYQERPVLVAIDSVQSVFDLSFYETEKLQRIPAERMSMTESLGTLMMQGLDNGMVVGAVSARDPCTRKLPVAKLQKEGYKQVHVPAYSKSEMQTMLQMYQETGVAGNRVSLSDASVAGTRPSSGKMTNQEANKLFMMTGGSGRLILDMLRSA